MDEGLSRAGVSWPFGHGSLVEGFVGKFGLGALGEADGMQPNLVPEPYVAWACQAAGVSSS